MAAEAAIKSFRQFEGCRVVGCDIYPAAWLSTSGLVDAFYQVPKATNLNYLDTIANICTKHSIDFIVPLTDPEVDVFSASRSSNLPATVCIANENAISTSRDKLKLYRFFQSSSLVKGIPTYTKTEALSHPLPPPVIAKPKSGRSSEGIVRLHRLDLLQESLESADQYIFQPILNGVIYTVDYVRDGTGKEVSIPRKELLRTSNGAGLTVETLKESQLAMVTSEIGRSLDILGCVNMEFIFDGTDFFLMDINPRFSAGVAFSKLTGYDMCKNHIFAFMGKEIEDLEEADYGVYIKKYCELKSQ